MQRRFSAWYAVVGLVGLSFVSCPKPPDPNKMKTGGTPMTLPDKAPGDEFADCYGQDWTRPEKIEQVLKVKCNDPARPFEEKIQPCFSYDWAAGKAPAEMAAVCEKVGFKERVGACKSYDWRYPDDIDTDDRDFCRRIGFRDIVDPEICEKQDWTKPDQVKPLLKEQCLKISVLPKCNPSKDKGCIPAADVVFSHTQHGVDLPNEKAKITMQFKGKAIACADCHSGECKTDKKTKTIKADVNRPGHDSCSGNRTGGCHPEFLSSQKMCSACHNGKPGPGKKALKAYGTDVVVQGQQYGFDFSHKSHIDPNGLVAKDGSRTAKCADCHTLVVDKKNKNIDGVKMTQAGHTQCGQCHCDSRNQIPMNDCLACHKQDSAKSAQSGHSYLDYRPHAQAFKHKSHQIGPDKNPVACDTCHVAVAETESIEEIPVPPMLGCLQGCHDGTHTNDPTPAFDGWIQCAECHAPGELPPSTTAKDKKKKK
jgi:hypothetical protein